jgi:hypothetical protein
MFEITTSDSPFDLMIDSEFLFGDQAEEPSHMYMGHIHSFMNNHRNE